MDASNASKAGSGRSSLANALLIRSVTSRVIGFLRAFPKWYSTGISDSSIFGEYTLSSPLYANVQSPLSRSDTML